MAATAWTKPSPIATLWSNSRVIPLLGVLMNDTHYIMNDTVATMNDQQNNTSLYAAPTAWSKPVV